MSVTTAYDRAEGETHSKDTQMAFMGTLDAGEHATINFAADGGNTGTSVVLGTWLGGDNLPDGPVFGIAPGTNQSVTVAVPDCSLFQINVHLTPGGHGALTVTQGKTTTAKPITDDATWILMVGRP